MIHKGFYDCPECLKKPAVLVENEPTVCSLCNGTRIDPNKNIGELLMLIITELGEAVEAHRKGRFSPKELDQIPMIECFNSDKHKYTKEAIKLFETAYKDTFQDEIADVLLRLCDLCGYLKLTILPMSEFNLIKWKSDNISQQIKQITKIITNIDEDYISNFYVSVLYEVLMVFCQKHSIDIEKHVVAKITYNKTRPYKHGKKY